MKFPVIGTHLTKLSSRLALYLIRSNIVVESVGNSSIFPDIKYPFILTANIGHRYRCMPSGNLPETRAKYVFSVYCLESH